MPVLDFKGKQFVYSHHLSVPFRQLEVDKGKSLSDTPNLDDNLIIHGDNLHALKALLPQYAGKIKCIYIDPPYNTGNEGWCYNDNVNAPLIKEWLKASANPVDGEDLERHDKWLCMMWARLTMLKNLLSDDGTIFVSIDDTELYRLRAIMDEIFGEEHFVAQLIWKSRQFPDARAKTHVSTDHEYILVYSSLAHGGFRGIERDETKFSNPDNDPRGDWMSRSILGLATEEQRPNLHFSIKDPKTGFEYEPPSTTGWRYDQTKMAQLIDNDAIIFPKKKDGRPREKKFRKDLLSEHTSFPSIIDDVYTSHGTKELRDIFGQSVFDFPKPSELIRRLIEQITIDGDIILDSFAGSGTTAHSTLQLNKELGENRRFILVECENYADTLTAERVRRVIQGGIESKNNHLQEGLGGTFTFCTLGDEINIESLLKGENPPDYESLARYVYYTATGKVLEDVAKASGDYFIGETDLYRVHLIYRPDRDFMRSNDSALNVEMVERIAESNIAGKRCLVFASAKFMGQKELTAKKIDFCQLPYAIHRVLGD